MLTHRSPPRYGAVTDSQPCVRGVSPGRSSRLYCLSGPAQSRVYGHELAPSQGADTIGGLMGRLDGKVAFITGAARGQGRSHAVRLAEEGADIVALDILTDYPGLSYPMAAPGRLDETADLVKGHNRRLYTAEVDVRDYGALKA